MAIQLPFQAPKSACLYPTSCFDSVLHTEVMMLLFHQQVRAEWLIPLNCETQTGCLGSYWIPANPWHHPPPTGPWISSSRPTWANVSPHFIFIPLEKTRHTTLQITSFSPDELFFCFFSSPPRHLSPLGEATEPYCTAACWFRNTATLALALSTL